MLETESDGGEGASQVEGSSDDVSPELASQIDAAFQGMTDSGEDEAGDDAPAPSRAKAVNQEQADELEQEGLENVDKTGEADQTESPKSSDDEPDDEAVAGTDKAPQPGKEVPALDPMLRFAAQEMGWTDEKINRLLTADPELAQDTFTALADAHANLSRQMAGLGVSQVAPGTQPALQQPAQPEASPTPKLDKIIEGLSAFADSNGEELAEFVKAVNEELAAPLKSMIAETRVQQQRLNAQEAQSTFGSIRKDFESFYGPESGTLSATQQKARTDMAAIADQIRAGAERQGKVVSITDAIKRAHAVVAADHRQAEARKAVASQVQNRSRSITAKPTQRRSPMQVGVRSDEAALSAYERKAAELGVEIDGY